MKLRMDITRFMVAAMLASVPVVFAVAQEKQAAADASSRAAKQLTFPSADDAADALADAVRKGNSAELLQILGPASRNWLLTSDDVADRAEWRVFLAAYDKKHVVERAVDDRAVLTVGEEDWPFPAPIVHKAGRWSFDADAGREEIINRRVGRNELDTIQTLLAIVDAQREYAEADSNGDGLNDYAARFASTPGKKDGLYWETAEGATPSPMGPLVAKAVREGYGTKVKAGEVTPYRGYLFRMLTSQGPHAPGGAYDYVVNGHLFGGFAVVAYPADYGNSGVKTFVVNHDGVVYEKDLGTATTTQAEGMKGFDPDKTWAQVQ
jgi:hypothetical protein